MAGALRPCHGGGSAAPCRRRGPFAWAARLCLGFEIFPQPPGGRAGGVGQVLDDAAVFEQGHARADVDASGGNTFNGKGGANASNTFSGTLTVTVDQVLVNGNLHVVGEKQIAINQGTEFIRFSGVVNPRTISGTNTVPSTQVADARIEYVGNGYINEAQNMGWLQRFFLNLSPM